MNLTEQQITDALRGTKYESKDNHISRPEQDLKSDARENAARAIILTGLVKELVETLKKVTDSYEWACFCDLGVEGFRNLDDETTEEEVGWEGMGEECDADAIDRARSALHQAKQIMGKE